VKEREERSGTQIIRKRTNKRDDKSISEKGGKEIMIGKGERKK
jgi:hypothetical protein